MPLGKSFDFARRLGGLGEPLIPCWEGPQDSPLQEKELKRACFRGYLTSEQSELTIQLASGKIKNCGLVNQVLACSSLLLSDAASRIVEASSPEGVVEGRLLGEEVLVLGPRAALMIPLLSLDDTQRELTALSEQEPMHSITAIKWRRSTHGGRTWAKPLKLSQATQAEISKA